MIHALRWQDDCRPAIRQADAKIAADDDEPLQRDVAPPFAHAEARSLSQRLRYLPLEADGSVWLTLGAEYRLRSEAIDRPTYGATAAPGYVALDQRFLIHADLRSAVGARLFAQVAAAASRGRHPARSFDRSAPDVQQLFVDLPLGYRSAVLRVGRQEFDGDGSRLFALRDAANLRRTFDMVQLDWRPGADRLSLFYGSPVLNGPDLFDDRRTGGETLAGVIARRGWTNGSARGTFGIIAVERRRGQVVYQDARGRERRQTLAIRATVEAAAFTGNLTAGVQRGNTGGSRIRAWGLSGEAFGKAATFGLPIRLGASFGVASGDDRPGDRRLGTFDPLYPSLGYYTEAPIVFPGNTWDLHPQIVARLSRTLEVGLGIDIISRLTANDATYQSGLPRLAPHPGGNLLGMLPNLKLTWTPSAHAALGSVFVHAVPGVAASASGAQPVNYGMIQVSFRY